MISHVIVQLSEIYISTLVCVANCSAQFAHMPHRQVVNFPLFFVTGLYLVMGPSGNIQSHTEILDVVEFIKRTSPLNILVSARHLIPSDAE